MRRWSSHLPSEDVPEQHAEPEHRCHDPDYDGRGQQVGFDAELSPALDADRQVGLEMEESGQKGAHGGVT